VFACIASYYLLYKIICGYQIRSSGATSGQVHAFSRERSNSVIVTGTVALLCNRAASEQRKASMMATKQILEGARSFKTAPLTNPADPANCQAAHSRWRWPAWPRIGFSRKDLYLIDIRPRRLPEA
jgi:hypothetical protein